MAAFYIVSKIILIVIILLVSLFIAMYTTLAERKVAAFMQDRIGPNRAGPLGILQPLCDGIKLFTKEEFIPKASNKFLFILGPSLAMIMACLGSAVIPWAPDIIINGQIIPIQVANLDFGILYVFAVVALGVYGAIMGGWASNNKYSLLGAVRAASQNISYEIPMGLSIVALIIITGTLNMREIVEGQAGLAWNIFVQPLGFLLFLICAFAETNRLPFDLPECENELNGGYHLEYSSMKLGFYLFAEYINMFVSSAIIATLYLGGYNFPGIAKLYEIGLHQNIIALLGILVLFLKIILIIFFFIWVRWTIPRFRYDQLMKLGWKYLIPLAILNIIITSVI
ncbi:MAG: NADH-quinone oxidoreductase subunit NuoH [Solitalea-like symbiont of Acarus siro]